MVVICRVLHDSGSRYACVYMCACNFKCNIDTCYAHTITDYDMNIMYITQCSSTVYIGIVQVTQHQPCTFENSNFDFHYAHHFTFEEISVKNR